MTERNSCRLQAEFPSNDGCGCMPQLVGMPSMVASPQPQLLAHLRGHPLAGRLPRFAPDRVILAPWLKVCRWWERDITCCCNCLAIAARVVVLPRCFPGFGHRIVSCGVAAGQGLRACVRESRPAFGLGVRGTEEVRIDRATHEERAHHLLGPWAHVDCAALHTLRRLVH